MNRLASVALLAALAAAPVPLPAQDLAFASVVAHKPVQVSIRGPGISQQVAGPTAGTNVLAGFNSSCSVAGASGAVSGQFTVSDQTLNAVVSAACVRGLLRGGEVLTHGPSFVIHLAVPRAMPVRLRWTGFVIASLGAPAPTARVDIGNDGSAEIDFTAQPGVCVPVGKDLVVDLPAGLVPIRIDLQADLPATVTGSLCQSIGTNLTIEPAHVEVRMESAGCGASLDATPMLDGATVRFYVGPSDPSTPVCLVFGTQPTTSALPLAPFCPLLVDPLVVLPIAPMAWTSLPLASLGPIELLVQGVTLRPPSPWLVSGLLTTPRGTLTVR